MTNFSNSLNKCNNIWFHVFKIVFVGITNRNFVLGLKLTCFSPSRADIGLSFDDLWAYSYLGAFRDIFLTFNRVKTDQGL